MERVGILGGTFDPPHIGHLILADAAATQLNLSTVLFCPVGQPVHKTTMTPAAHRIEMTRRAISGDDRFRISTLDVDRDPPHYTADLLPLIKDLYRQSDLFLIMGGDSLGDLLSWSRPEEILDLVRLAVLARPGAEIDFDPLHAALPNLKDRLQWLAGPSVDVSSTLIRQLRAQGDRLRYLLHESVQGYLSEHQLYQTAA